MTGKTPPYRLKSYQQSDSGSVTGNGRKPHLINQFSHIGDEEDEIATAQDNQSSILLCCHRAHRKGFTAVCLGLIVIALFGLNVYRVRSPVATSSQYKSCPIQESYFVSSELMGLKNSCTVEDVHNGAVATDQPVCSQVGLSILKDGGNAADSAVATALCLGVVNPASSGIGGGAFILVHSDLKTLDEVQQVTTPFEDARSEQYNSSIGLKVTEFIDCRETAPQNATADMFEADPKTSMLGGLAIGTPGELRGLELLHQRHGSLSWERLVQPSIKLAKRGFKVGAYLAKEIQEHENTIRKLPHLATVLTKNNDKATLLREGDTMKRPQYAKTLEAIAKNGADAFYEGDMSKILAKDIQDAGGIIMQSDISNYKPVMRDPIKSKVAGYNVIGSPPPSSGGGAIIGALRFLAGFAMPYSAFADTLSKHWYLEACQHVFAIRMSLSDPSFYPDTNSNAIKDLTEGSYIESLRLMTLDNFTLNLSQYGGPAWAQLNDSDGKDALEDAQEGDRRRNLRSFNYLNDHGTTSFSIVDKNRNTVTMTSSVNLGFGSKVVSPSTGIILNNVMDDFASPGRVNYFGLHPSEANYVAPGKRPLSSMSPTMVFRNSEGETALGKLVLSLGASGGPKIITSVLQTILNYASIGMPLYEAISQPRVHNQLLYHGAVGTNIEHDTLPQGPTLHLTERTANALIRRGHKVVRTDFLGTVQAVAIDLEADTLTAVSDVRKQGMAAGY